MEIFQKWKKIKTGISYFPKDTAMVSFVFKDSCPRVNFMDITKFGNGLLWSEPGKYASDI